MQVTSESLQAKVRELLPSQQGFGADLQATNVIVPIVDLTRTAEGSTVGENLQTAQGFADITAFRVSNTTSVIANTTGFFQIRGTVSAYTGNNASSNATLTFTDGLSVKNLYRYETIGTTSLSVYGDSFDLVVFLTSGDSISATSSATFVTMNGTIRQIADVNGNLVNPSGFNPQ